MYTKKNWVSGETVTATALNNIENGICSLPVPELGKRLQVLVDENQTQEVVIVPEQSVTTTSSGGVRLNNVDDDSIDIFYRGFDALLSIDNVEHQVSYKADEYAYTDSSTGYKYGVFLRRPKGTDYLVFYVIQNNSYVSGTYTVKLTTLAPKAYWGIEQEQQALDPISE